MARQGNYVPIGSINSNWGQGLSSSLSDLSKTLLSQASDAKNREALQNREAEQKRQFDLGYDLDKAAAAEATRQADRQYILDVDKQNEDIRQFNANSAESARINDSNIASQDLNRRLLTTKEQERLNQLAVNKATNEALFGATKAQNFGIEAYPAVQQTAFNRIKDSIDNESLATQAFMVSPTESNRQALLQASKQRYAITDLGEGAANTEANKHVQRVSNFLLDSGNNTGADIETASKYINDVYANDYNRLNNEISSGRAIPLTERFEAWANKLPIDVIQNTKREDLIKRFKEVTGVKSRQDMLSSANALSEQSYNDAIKQAELFDKYYQRSKTTGTNRSSASRGSDAKNFETMRKQDIGSSDNEDRNNAYVALREDPNITPDGAFAAIMSMTEDGWDTSFPDIGDNPKAGETLKERALRFSRGDTSFSSSITPDKSDYAINRSSPRSINQLLVDSISFPPSNNSPVPVSALYDTDLINEQVLSNRKSNSGLFRPTVTPTDKNLPVTDSTDSDSNYTRPSGNLISLKKELEKAKAENIANLNTDKEDRVQSTVTTFNKVKDLKKQISELEFNDRRASEVTDEINMYIDLLEIPTLQEDQRKSYKTKISDLKKELKRYTPK